MSIPPNWYETFFHGVTLDLWRRAIPPEQTTAEADFLVQNLNCESGARVLDVPCGNGRLTFELASRGYRVTGVDLAEEFIAEARSRALELINPPAKLRTLTQPLPKGEEKQAGGTDLTASAQFILGDMRSIEGVGVYDGAFCFGNSFGFLEYADMEKFLAGVARALKPGARFLVNTAMAAESVLPDFEEQSCHEMGDIVMTIKERYVAEESCVDSEYIFERNGEIDSRKAKHWIYTVAEIRRMLERAGFEVLHCFGSLQGEAFKLGERELFVVSEVSVPRALATGSSVNINNV
jgi:SAM-dependent methyltransferase